MKTVIEQFTIHRNDPDIDFNKVDRLIEQGRYFSALQCVNGMLGCFGYRPALFAKLADIYALASETEQAGRYYFYSGIREEGISDLVKHHAQRLKETVHANKGEAIANDVPKKLRKLPVERIPGPVLSDLHDAGLTNEALNFVFAIDRTGNLRNLDKALAPLSKRTFKEQLISAVLVGAGIGAFVSTFAVITIIFQILRIVTERVF